MTGSKRMLTLRIQVTVPYRSKRPQRVRVVAKDRGAMVFAYRRELACVPLYKAGWRRVPGDEGAWLWQNEQAVAVSVDMARLLRYRKLALQLYCLRGDDVKHKGVFNLRRVMEQQQREDELLLAMQYSTGWWWRCLAFTCSRRPKDGLGPQRGGGENQRLDNKSTLPKAQPLAGVAPLDREQADEDSSTSEHGPSHATDGPDTSQDVICGLSGAGDDPSVGQHAGCDTATAGQLGELESPRPVRFPNSGAVFPELLREHDLWVTEEKADPKENQREETSRTQHDVKKGGEKVRCLWRTSSRVLGVAGGMGTIAVLWAGVLLDSEGMQPIDWLLCGVGAAILLVDFCVQGCKWLRRRRGATNRERHRRPAEGDSPAD